MKVGFYSNQLSYRGTEQAMFLYAKYTKAFYNISPVIITHANADTSGKDLFSRFDIIYTDCKLNDVVKANDIDIIYTIQSGEPNEIKCDVVPFGIHVVFGGYKGQSDRVATISDFMGKKHSLPVVHHIIEIPKRKDSLGIRRMFGIPENAILVGSYGGYGQFNIPYAINAMKKAIAETKDLYFLLMGFGIETLHEHIISIKPSIDKTFKDSFISSCDYMIHAQAMGETFGLACAEFNAGYKKVITTYGTNNAHIEHLGENAIIYNSEEELINILLSLKKGDYAEDVMTKRFSPEAIMPKFKRVFL